MSKLNNKKMFKKSRVAIAVSSLLILSGCTSFGHNISAEDARKVSELSQKFSEGKILSETSDKRRVLFNVAKGDTLSSIFNKANVKQDFFKKLNSNDLDKLSNIHPGDVIEITADKDDKVITMAKTVKGQGQKWIVVDKKNDNEYLVSKKEMKSTYQQRNIKGVIENDFMVTTRNLNIGQPVAREFINIMHSQIDIPKNKNKGDTFDISYRQMYLNDRPVGEPIIIGATYQENMTMVKHTAFRFKNSFGNIEYYDINGNSLSERKFNLHPMKKYARISSHFNPKRRHPITGRIRPHNGTDYAAVTGTPIYASADGRISFKGKNGGFGNMVKIAHPNGVETLYAHMSRYNNKYSTGDKVKSGDLIGYVGATGAVTGPHLHYELHVNGKPIDSLREGKRLVGNSKLSGADLLKFKRETGHLYRNMASLKNNEDSYITQVWDIQNNNVLL